MNPHPARSLLYQARHHFDHHGRIPADIAAKLMQYGYIVPEMERAWAGAPGR